MTRTLRISPFLPTGVTASLRSTETPAPPGYIKAFTWTKTRLFANESPETWWASARTCNAPLVVGQV